MQFQVLCHFIVFFPLALEDVECQVAVIEVSLRKSCGVEMTFLISENYLTRVGKICFAVFYGFQYVIHNF